MATLLGKNAEAEDFASRAEEVKNAVNFKYFDKEKGTYLPECQGNLILPLYLDMVPDGFRDQVAECLVSYIVEKDHYHISTGSHTTRFLFETLSKIGRDDLALKMLHVKSYPSFGYMLENGATSLWERWEKTFGFMTSHNHPMSGGFGVWFLKVLGGICVDSDDPARLLVSPHVPDGLNHVNCDRVFRNGRAVSNWYKVGDEVHYDITVPWNMTAQVKIECSCAAIEQVEINGEKLSLSGVDYHMADGCLLIDNAAGYLHIRVMKR
jgi:alpha-L-rhamnosidase